MKKALIGGFFALIGTIWSLALILLTSEHLVSAWSTPPGRFITSLAELRMAVPFALSLLLLLLGLVLLGVAYFRKD